MDKAFVVLFIYLVGFKSFSCREEPRCSKYDFEEKVLEKIVRFEHKMEIMTDSVNEISTKVKDDIHKMKSHMTELTANIRTEWSEIKKEFELMKNAVVEQETILNDTTQKSFEELSAKILQSSYAFSAYDLSASRPSTGDTLVFAKTHLNEDGAYSTTRGTFTTCCDGIYEFHATLVSNQSKKYIWVEFKAGGKAIGRFQIGAGDREASSSGSAMARLQKGIEVYLRVTFISSGFRFLEDSYRMNTFSGHLSGN